MSSTYINRKVVHQRLTHGIDGQTLGGDVRNHFVNFELRRNKSVLDRDRLVSLAFIEQEEEGFILDYRSADVCMELVVMDRRWLALAGLAAVIVIREIVIGITEAAMIDPGRCAMPGVG